MAVIAGRGNSAKGWIARNSKFEPSGEMYGVLYKMYTIVNKHQPGSTLLSGLYIRSVSIAHKLTLSRSYEAQQGT